VVGAGAGGGGRPASEGVGVEADMATSCSIPCSWSIGRISSRVRRDEQAKRKSSKKYQKPIRDDSRKQDPVRIYKPRRIPQKYPASTKDGNIARI
jgi:hypothetical protein